MQVIEVAGSHRQMGAEFGEACRDDVRGLFEARVLNAIEQAKTYGGHSVTEAHLIEIAKASLPIVQDYHPAGFEELQGIAEGSGLGLERVWVMNALTDLRDIAAYTDVALWAPPVDGEGCSSFIVKGDSSADGTGFVGQTWDLSTSNMPFVRIVKRRPAQGPATVCLTTVGCLSLIGMNEHNVSIGTTNIRTLDARKRVCYLDVIHCALHQEDLESAVRVMAEAPRAGAHYFYVMDGQGRAAGLECSAQQHARIDVKTGHYVHCNHMLEEAVRGLEAQGTPVQSSMHRQGRLSTLLSGAQGQMDAARLQGFLADHDGQDRGICRHDFNGISSNGSVIMNPEARRLWTVHGPACEGSWAEHQV